MKDCLGQLKSLEEEDGRRLGVGVSMKVWYGTAKTGTKASNKAKRPPRWLDMVVPIILALRRQRQEGLKM